MSKDYEIILRAKGQVFLNHKVYGDGIEDYIVHLVEELKKVGADVELIMSKEEASGGRIL